MRESWNMMTKKEKRWCIAAIVALILAAAYFTGVLIWVDSLESSIEPEEFEVERIEMPPIEIVETDFEVEQEKQSIGNFTLTAYCSCEKCCGEWARNRPVDEMGNEIVIGASGARLISNVSVAVDPSIVRYGTELEIDGKTYIAHDCGGAIQGNRIDVYFSNHADALQFGVQTREVYIRGGEHL